MNKLLYPPASGAAAKSPARKLSQTQADFLKTLSKAGFIGVSVKDLATRFKISRETLTRITGFSPRAVANWTQGSKPSSSTARRLTEIKRLFATLEQLLSPEAIGPWLRQPNPAFDGSTPLQVIERGETDRIWRMVYEMESGEPA